jgi:RNA polymerase sigma-70 factor (ECF subfamily)
MSVHAVSTESPQDDDAHLVTSAAAGDDRAFAELVTRYKRRVFRLAARFTRSEHELDDLCQEIFLKVYENLKQYRGDAPFEHWLSRIAVRTCYDALRKQRHEKRHLPLDDLASEPKDHRIDAQLSAAEARSVVMWAVARLKPEERLVITLMELEEKSVKEIAGLTGWTEINVKVRAWRARQALKRILEETGHER